MTDVDSATEPAPLGALPAAVRTVIIGWAAEALSGMPPAQVPAALVRVARFTPAKRARLGAVPLAQAVDSDPGFRAAVAERARAGEPVGTDDDPPADLAADLAADLPADLPGGEADPATSPARAAALAHLLRLPTGPELIAAVADHRPVESQARATELQRTVRRLQRDLNRVTADRDEARSNAGSVGTAADEVDKLRRRLREQGTKLRQAEEAVRVSAARTQQELDSLRGEVQRLAGELANSQERARLAAERADRAQETLGRLREQTGIHKATADRRLDLLLSTVEGAVGGLRREWDLAGGGIDPADVVAGRMPANGAVPESTGEPSRLNTWLGLPAAHLIVDGYNVSKTGYPGLSLAQQRDRLVRALAALAARTSAEVTVVFDGAAVAVPAPPGRGIRVLFSPPGVIADDVIRDLVSAEPAGRVVLVVTSDRELANGVLRRGARTAGANVLLGLIG